MGEGYRVDSELNAKAAVAGIATTTDAINLTSAVTKGYGDTSLEAVQKVSDLAFQTFKLGQTTFPELAGSIGRVTPLAASLGVSMEEMFGVMATGTGVTGTASEVSTQLRGILQSLMSPTEGMTGLLDEMGFASGNAMLDQLGLQGTIKTLVDTANATGAPLQDYIGSIEGQTLALALAGAQSDTFTQKLNEMSNVSGIMDEAFKEQTEGVNTAGHAWNQFKQKIAVTSQKLGDELAPMLMRGVEWFSNLDGRVQAVILTVIGIVAALGPLLIIAGSIMSAITVLIPVITALGVAIMGVTWPVVAVIAGIAVLIAIGVLLYRNWDTVIGWAKKLGKYVADNWEKILAFIPGIGLLVSAGKALYDNWDVIKAKASALGTKLSEVWSGVLSNVKSVWGGIESTIKGAVNGIIGMINRFIGGVNSIKISVPSVDIPLLGKVGGFTIGMPNIPTLPSLDIGTNSVLSDGLAMIHAGEAIVPANVASGGYNGGGGDVHIHINSQYIDREALSRFVAEIDREMGWRIGGKY